MKAPTGHARQRVSPAIAALLGVIAAGLCNPALCDSQISEADAAAADTATPVAAPADGNTDTPSATAPDAVPVDADAVTASATAEAAAPAGDASASVSATAQVAAPDGEDAAEASATAQGDDDPADAAAPPPNSAEQQRYIDSVARIESASGAWDPDLAEHLLGLGISYQQQGRHEDALPVLQRAAHITRINQGLYSPADIPIVERLIESEAAMGNWETVSGSYQQLYQIHQRNFGERDPRLLPVLRNLSGWHLRAWVDSIGKEPLNHLITARNLYDSSLQILHSNYGPEDVRLADTLRERAIVDYYLAASPQPATSGPGLSFGGMPQPQLPEGPATYIVNGFVSGRDALEKVVQLHRNDPGGSPVATARAIAELGDWHLLFGRRQTAMTLYHEAQAMIAQTGDTEGTATQQLFGAPIELPVMPKGFAKAMGTQSYDSYILVNFAVDARGKPGEPEVVKAEPAPPDSQMDRLRKRLRYTRFRPRFEGSEPVATSGLSYLFRYSL